MKKRGKLSYPSTIGDGRLLRERWTRQILRIIASGRKEAKYVHRSADEALALEDYSVAPLQAAHSY